MSFGFSVGDFVSTLGLVATVVAALRASGGASARYNEVRQQLESLQTALHAVQALELEESQYVELAALRCAASQCRNTIEHFWKKQEMFQSYLKDGGSGSKVRDGLMKIRWTFCEAENLIKFKNDLMGHTQAIQLMLRAMHLANIHARNKQQGEQNNVFVKIIERSTVQCWQGLTAVAGQSRVLLALLLRVM
ncbi:uncharacterized protein PAC_00764 [Phialocephala subalpina]|uniref:Fungal N-terminal domain-containing protein n=1 Tax=Phialocephala subalpina TaxID=576137 RepID=A0A1L7WDM7_9HELO|nr:uncharacterized protein PAC_00764 [Phialocephala subalpina]